LLREGRRTGEVGRRSRGPAHSALLTRLILPLACVLYSDVHHCDSDSGLEALASARACGNVRCPGAHLIGAPRLAGHPTIRPRPLGPPQVTLDFKLALPQVAVVGSQSSGKSSVLEALVRGLWVLMGPIRPPSRATLAAHRPTAAHSPADAAPPAPPALPCRCPRDARLVLASRSTHRAPPMP
jgi:hypothetical protein